MTTVSSCCSSKNQTQSDTPPLFDYQNLETICRIAIGAFALMTSPLFFVPALVLGALGGGVYRICKQDLAIATERNRPLCTQGYSELLSNRRYPEELNLAITALFIGVHAYCMPKFYIPFCGVYLGIWASDQLVELGTRCFDSASLHCQV